MYFLKQEQNVPDKRDYYLAQIAAEVRRTFAKKGAEISVKDFLLQFESGKPKSVKSQERSQKYKKSWLNMFGIEKGN